MDYQFYLVAIRALRSWHFYCSEFLISSKKSTESKRVGRARKDEVKKVVIATKKTAKKAEPKK